MTRRSSTLVRVALGALLATLTVACAPTPPSTPPLDPMTCVRTTRTISPAPGKSATNPKIGAGGSIGVFQVDDGSGPPLPISFGLFSASFNVYRYDGVAETTTRLNPIGTTSIEPDLSRDGSVVAYATVTNSGIPAVNLGIDVWSAATGSITRITGTATGRSGEPAVSGDGRYVAFVSDATTLVPGDPDVNSNLDLFLFDRDTSVMRRLTDQTAQWATLTSFFGPRDLRISDDGSTIVLARYRLDDGHGELLSIDRATAAVTAVLDLAGAPSPNPDPPGGTIQPFILVGDPSADGSVVPFSTAVPVAGVTPDPNGAPDVFVWTRVGGQVTQVTATPLVVPTGAGPISYATAVSGDGRYVSFSSNLVSPSDHISDPPALLDPPGVATYLLDRSTGYVVSLASHLSSDASADAGAIVGTSGTAVKASICT